MQHQQSSFNKILKINIILQKQNDKWPMSIQQQVTLTQNKQILLNQIILKLKSKSFNDMFNTSVSYFHYGKKLFVFGFFIPLEINENQLQANYSRFSKRIPFQALQQINGQFNCILKLRKKIKTKVEQLILQQQQKFGQSLINNALHSMQSQRRTTKQKQKTIGQVIEKVSLWRKLYTGFPSQNGQVVHYQLQNAAQSIGVIKKTLDDYLLQIRNGKRHGYNFHKNKDCKIGDLRSFVREKKEEKGKK